MTVLMRIIILLVIGAAVFLLKRKLSGSGPTSELTLPSKYRINNESLPTLVYFWTEQCSQCKLIQKPVIQRLKTNRRNFNLVTINAFNDREVASRFKIMTVPSTVVFSSDGKSKFVNNGLIGEDELSRQLREAFV